jgi:FeS assembly SUF system protein
MTEPNFSVEEISEAAPVPRQPPLRAQLERAPDYLEGFLSPKPEAVASPTTGGELYDEVILALRQIFDPEIPVNIYDLGLIYAVEIDEGHAVVTMTLTTPHCPVAETMPGEVEMRVMSVPGIASAEVALVWDPPWDPGKMSDEAKLEMGML